MQNKQIIPILNHESWLSDLIFKCYENEILFIVHSNLVFLQKLKVERAFEKQGWFNSINSAENKNLFYSTSLP